MHANIKRVLRSVRHLGRKLLSRRDPWFFVDQFQDLITKRSFEQYAHLLEWADTAVKNQDIWENPTRYAASTDPVVKQGWKLRQEVMAEFKDKCATMSGMRILIHIPNETASPAGYSIFLGMLESFRFLGIQAEAFPSGTNIRNALEKYKPTIFISSDHPTWLDQIDWNEIRQYRQRNRLIIGLTAGLEEYGNTPLKERLAWAKEHAVDFYYSYRDTAYIQSRPEYRPYFDAGYKIFSVPFGANPLIHYPVPLDMPKDIDYIFIASSQGKAKGERYFRYMGPIVSTHDGFISGNGWKHVKNFTFNRHRDRYLYSRSKLGLNIHLSEQIEWASEVNERTYQLAACGVPQVVDHAKILDTLFGPDTVFIANTPKQYHAHAEYILNHPLEAERRALKAQKEVFEKHTSFHRAFDFATMIDTCFKPS